VVFLLLAALYESWTIPLAVLLTVPLGICGAVIAATMRGLPNDVHFTVGLITIIGLAAKDAISSSSSPRISARRASRWSRQRSKPARYASARS
jgi:multidrug efflux pump subunit AcrB